MHLENVSVEQPKSQIVAFVFRFVSYVTVKLWNDKPVNLKEKHYISIISSHVSGISDLINGTSWIQIQHSFRMLSADGTHFFSEHYVLQYDNTLFSFT